MLFAMELESGVRTTAMTKLKKSMAMNGEIIVYLHWLGTIHRGSGLMNKKNCCHNRRKKKLELVEGLEWNKVLEDKNE
ncbi:hypothetical protein OUZ56_026638 [Daphnia magna]|uniref:Uncharacterized protein n=1 Tax=Daphnia magna TaxID=35525 RepID=A0ABQ9ZMS0_9CRUS|nr:hypothetical protein OUZ56_026638 [Daphnia magna]